MAVMYRTLYFSGLQFAQSQQAISLKALWFFLYWSVYAHIPSLEIHIYKAESCYYKKKKEENQPIYLDFVFVNFWTDGNIPQWKFYKNFHLLTEYSPEIFPWWKCRAWVINHALRYLHGIFTYCLQKSQKAVPLQSLLFFSFPLGKWPIPSSQAQQYEQGRYSVRRGCTAQTREEALLCSPRAGGNFWSLNNC